MLMFRRDQVTNAAEKHRGLDKRSMAERWMLHEGGPPGQENQEHITKTVGLSLSQSVLNSNFWKCRVFIGSWFLLI